MIHEFLIHLVDRLMEKNPDIESEEDVSYEDIKRIVSDKVRTSIILDYVLKNRFIELISDILYSTITGDYSHKLNYSNSFVLVDSLTCIEELCANLFRLNSTSLDEQDKKLLHRYFNFPSVIPISQGVIRFQPFPVNYYSLNKIGLVGEIDRNVPPLFGSVEFELLPRGLLIDITTFVLTCINLFKTVVLDCSMAELINSVIAEYILRSDIDYILGSIPDFPQSDIDIRIEIKYLMNINNYNQISNNFSFELKDASYTLNQFKNAFTDEFQKQITEVAKYYQLHGKMP